MRRLQMMINNNKDTSQVYSNGVDKSAASTAEGISRRAKTESKQKPYMNLQTSQSSFSKEKNELLLASH